ncbi:hypothetical protein B0H63DRAFT_315449 [Podospora didyma]|uniref:Oxidoreductase acuF-like C2H2 type zinc-finger domain-containing protein n=1 Tax=Podospora didyma TaxID=330526 RepID=A0AAE0K5D4_9PEZI|nr:hypothetical protein B0H63DRAFT_315449 [Podospora didyma]
MEGLKPAQDEHVFIPGYGTGSALSSSANLGEDWTNTSDRAERRRIQNRITQREYRKKLKGRLEDLERRAEASNDALIRDPNPQPNATSISQKSRHVRERFLGLITLLEDKQQDGTSVMTASPVAVTDALERFTLWAGNMGAMKNPLTKLSLDYRLQSTDAADVRTHIQRQLDEILEAIDSLKNITLGTSPNRDMSLDADINSGEEEDDDTSSETSDMPSDEANMTLEIISECIKSLFRIGVLVRKSTPRDRFKRALQNSELVFPPSFDIDYVRHKHPKAGSDWLSARLGRAISKRRQFIKYCRDHKSRLGADDHGREGPTTKNLEGLEILAAATERLSSKATTFVPAKQLQEGFEEDEHDDAVSIMSASTMTEALSVLKLPRLADLSPDQEPFECPICFTLQSFRHEKAWRSHAFRDLKPYVCTLGDADCEWEFFGDRSSWFEHELKHHRARYSCVLCSHGPLQSKNLRVHIVEEHGPFPPDQLDMLQDAGRETITKYRAQECPFCDDWADSIGSKLGINMEEKSRKEISVNASRFQRHVAAHQEQLAIFALPRATEEQGTPRSGSFAGSNSAAASLTNGYEDHTTPWLEEVTDAPEIFEQGEESHQEMPPNTSSTSSSPPQSHVEENVSHLSPPSLDADANPSPGPYNWETAHISISPSPPPPHSSDLHGRVPSLPPWRRGYPIAAQWTMEKVQMWLQANQFSRDWQETFKELQLHGAQFLEFGTPPGLSSVPFLKFVYLNRVERLVKRGAVVDPDKEMEDLNRMRRLIWGIVTGRTSRASRGHSRRGQDEQLEEESGNRTGELSQNPDTTPPPAWLSACLEELKTQHPSDWFDAVMLYSAIDPDNTHEAEVEMHLVPQISCNDCLEYYPIGPGLTIDNFKVHLASAEHRENVEERLARKDAPSQSFLSKNEHHAGITLIMSDEQSAPLPLETHPRSLSPSHGLISDEKNEDYSSAPEPTSPGALGETHDELLSRTAHPTGYTHCKAVPSCLNRTESGSDFCHYHECIAPGCTDQTAQEGSECFCFRHFYECQAENCHNSRLDPVRGFNHLRFCSEHACKVVDCHRRMNGIDTCMSHKGWRADAPYSPRSTTSTWASVPASVAPPPSATGVESIVSPIIGHVVEEADIISPDSDPTATTEEPPSYFSSFSRQTDSFTPLKPGSDILSPPLPYSIGPSGNPMEMTKPTNAFLLEQEIFKIENSRLQSVRMEEENRVMSAKDPVQEQMEASYKKEGQTDPEVEAMKAQLENFKRELKGQEEQERQKEIAEGARREAQLALDEQIKSLRWASPKASAQTRTIPDSTEESTAMGPKAIENRKKKETDEQEAIAAWKTSEAERSEKEKKDREQTEIEYQRRLQDELHNSGLDEKDIAVIQRRLQERRLEVEQLVAGFSEEEEKLDREYQRRLAGYLSMSGLDKEQIAAILEKEKRKKEQKNPPPTSQHRADDESDSSEIDDAEYQELLQARREMRRRKRLSSGALGKRTISESIGSDTGQEAEVRVDHPSVVQNPDLAGDAEMPNLKEPPTEEVSKTPWATPCTGNILVDKKWHAMPDPPGMTVCEECFDTVVWPLLEAGHNEVARNFLRRRQYRTLGVCHLNKKTRSLTRDIFDAACEKNDLEFLKKELPPLLWVHPALLKAKYKA